MNNQHLRQTCNSRNKLKGEKKCIDKQVLSILAVNLFSGYTLLFVYLSVCNSIFRSEYSISFTYVVKCTQTDWNFQCFVFSNEIFKRKFLRFVRDIWAKSDYCSLGEADLLFLWIAFENICFENALNWEKNLLPQHRCEFKKIHLFLSMGHQSNSH